MSEQFQNPIEKSQKEAKSILGHTNTCPPTFGTGTLVKSDGVKLVYWPKPHAFQLPSFILYCFIWKLDVFSSVDWNFKTEWNIFSDNLCQAAEQNKLMNALLSYSPYVDDTLL